MICQKCTRLRLNCLALNWPHDVALKKTIVSRHNGGSSNSTSDLNFYLIVAIETPTLSKQVGEKRRGLFFWRGTEPEESSSMSCDTKLADCLTGLFLTRRPPLCQHLYPHWYLLTMWDSRKEYPLNRVKQRQIMNLKFFFFFDWISSKATNRWLRCCHGLTLFARLSQLSLGQSRVTP